MYHIYMRVPLNIHFNIYKYDVCMFYILSIKYVTQDGSQAPDHARNILDI